MWFILRRLQVRSGAFRRNRKPKVSAANRRAITGSAIAPVLRMMPALIIADILHFLGKGSFIDFTFDIIAFLIMMSSVVFWWLYCSKFRHLPRP